MNAPTTNHALKKIWLACVCCAVLPIASCSHLKSGASSKGQSIYRNDPAELRAGAEVYNNHCARCHGLYADGEGIDARFRSVPVQSFVDGSFDKSLSLTAANITYGKGKEMPAFENKLTEREIRAVAAYVLSLNQKEPSDK